MVFVNEDVSPGLKRGGVLNIVRREVELVCPADAIPAEITVDLEAFDIGDSVHISHVALPEGVRPTITDRDFTIATISAPTVVAGGGRGSGRGRRRRRPRSRASRRDRGVGGSAV